MDPVRLAQLITTAESLTASGIPVLPIKPRAKVPFPNPDTGSWWVVDDPDNVATVFQQTATTLGDCNLAMVCGRAKGSQVLVVDIDGESGLAKAQELGVTSAADCWVQRTGGGGWHIVYFADVGLELRRHVKPQGADLDLVVDGYTLIDPSITEAPYRWVPGHGPGDIPLASLDSPPAALLAWWHEIQTKTVLTIEDDLQKNPSAYSLLKKPIPQGQRNDTLTRIAGWLRLYHPEPVVVSLLECINQALCTPEPLPHEEVIGIVKSVYRYPQPGVNGHPWAVINNFVRAPEEKKL